MLGDSKARQICEATHHEWKEEYYGYRCETCGEFIPFGCEPWMPLDDEEEDYHSYDCTCEDCLQNHPERDILYGDGEYFDWTGLTDDEAAQQSVQQDVACACDILSVMGGVMIGYKKDCPVASHAANASR